MIHTRVSVGDTSTIHCIGLACMCNPRMKKMALLFTLVKIVMLVIVIACRIICILILILHTPLACACLFVCVVWAAYRRTLELGNEDSNVGPGRSKH